ncbi:MAG: glycosyltransferase family 2 protein [Prevotellaceae bacterium]|nr:glycosyltransferase family 2 protein [Prevotellaceae bacterium]
MRLAIVILNWNGVGMMRRFLKGVVRHSQSAEVIVADNGSTDSSLRWLAEEMPGVRVIPLERNYGFAEGYNRALRQVEAEYYLLLNSDVEVRQGWFQPMLLYMEAHPEVAACQPKLLSQSRKDSFEYAGACGGFLDALGYPYCRGRVFGTVERDERQYDEPMACHWATGACLMIRSRDYWAAGGLDARFFAHQEEIDLCWRLRARGRRVVCVPASVAYHVGGGTLPAENPLKTFLNFRNNLLLVYKNMPAGRLPRVMALRLLLDAAASLRFLLAGQWRSSLAVPRAWWAFLRMRQGFREDRRENLRRAVCDMLGDSVGSILWQYYVRGRRTWAEIAGRA